MFSLATTFRTFPLLSHLFACFVYHPLYVLFFLLRNFCIKNLNFFSDPFTLWQNDSLAPCGAILCQTLIIYFLLSFFQFCTSSSRASPLLIRDSHMLSILVSLTMICANVHLLNIGPNFIYFICTFSTNPDPIQLAQSPSWIYFSDFHSFSPYNSRVYLSGWVPHR